MLRSSEGHAPMLDGPAPKVRDNTLKVADAGTISSETRFGVLDSWRGICALLVALHHFVTMGHLSGLSLVRNASLFVDFFFVLSGFVITHAYGRRVRSADDLVVFLVKRLGRIWPLHMVMLILLVCLEAARAATLDISSGAGPPRVPFTGANAWSYVLPNALLLHSLGFLPSLSWNIPSWSVSVEMASYLVFGAGLVLVGDELHWFACVMVALSTLILATMSLQYVDATETYGIFRCFTGFFVGHLIYRVRRREKPLGSSGLRAATAVQVGIVVALAVFISYADRGWLPVLAPFLFGVVVYVLSFDRGLIARILLHRPFTVLGKLSYSIYMVHYPIILVIGAISASVAKRYGLHLLYLRPGAAGVREKALSFGNSWADDLATIMFLAISVAAAAVTFRFIELPGQQGIVRLLRLTRIRPLPVGQAD